MKNWPFKAAMLCGVAGIVMLAIWFTQYWPGSGWTVVPRSQLIDKGRQVARQFGVDVTGWHAYPVASVTSADSHYGRGIPPLTVRITYVSRHGGEAAEVGFDADGTFNYWRAPDKVNTAQRVGAEAEVARAAFLLMAGTEAAKYRAPSRSAGDDDDEEEYEFKKTAASDSIKEQIKVITKKSAVERVQRKITRAGSDEDDDDEGYWDAFSALYAVIFIAGVTIAGAFLVLWIARKAIDRQFQIRMAIAAFIISMTTLLLGSGWDKIKSVHLDSNTPGIVQLFGALAVLLFVAVGRSISAKSRPKWISLEQLCLLAPISKATGHAIAAGLLFSPLLAAIPFLVAGCGLFRGTWVLANDAELLYSHSPVADILANTSALVLLLYFGFAVPAVERLVRFRWLSWLLVSPVGIILFAKVVSGPLAAPLTAGFLTLSLFWFVWAQFDMLAVLTLQLGAGLVLGLPVLAQKGQPIWTLVLALLVVVAAVIWFWLRGEKIPQGDPRATIPTVTGFRAEREKLMAEFSLARRAQQNMLPQAPPQIAGYSLAASCTPSLEVGGDLYDFLKLQDGRICIGVADVSGKGVPAALYMTLTKGLLSAVTQNSSDLGSVVEEVNRHLHAVTRKKVFVTMALGFLDAERRILQCVRAGHNPMVWRQKDRNSTILVSPKGLGLGITAGKIFTNQLQVEEMALSEGDAVVFYSDGITEAMNRELEQFGEQRLMDAVDRTDSLNAAAAHDSILTEVREFLSGVHPQDDMTIIFLRVDAPPIEAPMRG